MLFEKTDHASALPSRLTPRQILDVAGDIHDLVLAETSRHLASRPHYHAITKSLNAVDRARVQLAQSLNRKHFKVAANSEAGGPTKPAKPTMGDDLSRLKKKCYDDRRKAMSRFRRFIDLYLEEIDRPQKLAAATLLHELLAKRTRGFEKRSYAESNSEFKLLLKEVTEGEQGAAINQAIAALDLTFIFDQIQSHHDAFQRIHFTQTQRDHELEQRPKVKPSTAELRRAIRVLLTQLHFDIEDGDPTFKDVLGHVDEIIGKVGSVAAMRQTLSSAASGDNSLVDDHCPIEDAAPQDAADDVPAARQDLRTSEKELSLMPRVHPASAARELSGAQP